MIQLNLLPDIKMEYIKTRQVKQFVTTVSLAIAGASFLVMAILFIVVNVLQKSHLNALNRDIQTSSQKLQNTQDLNKILTIQNQLNSLPGLHDQKPVTTRLFTFLSQLTPNQANISKLDIDFEQKTISLNGSADSLEIINKFVDTLKFTTYAVALEEGVQADGSTVETAEGVTVFDESSKTRAFSSVVLSNFGLADARASYQINLTFDEAIFDSSQEVKLVVPKLITTRSETEKPAALFQAETTEGDQ